MRRVIQIVMLVALLLSGPALTASMMPCCMGSGMPVKAAVAAPLASGDDSMDMRDCHSAAMDDAQAIVAAHSAADMDCMGSLCVFHSNTQTTAYDLSERQEAVVVVAPLSTVMAIPPTPEAAALADPQTHPPSPLTATPLPLRV